MTNTPWENAKCQDCQDTGYVPTGIELKGMEAGGNPRMEVSFRRCDKGCPDNSEILLEWFGDSIH
jgi:hypothetical protein